jgi:hypothetical protein
LINKFGSVHFLYMIHPKNLQNLQKKKFPWGPKLEAFTVLMPSSRAAAGRWNQKWNLTSLYQNEIGAGGSSIILTKGSYYCRLQFRQQLIRRN